MTGTRHLRVGGNGGFMDEPPDVKAASAGSPSELPTDADDVAQVRATVADVRRRIVAVLHLVLGGHLLGQRRTDARVGDDQVSVSSLSARLQSLRSSSRRNSEWAQVPNPAAM